MEFSGHASAAPGQASARATLMRARDSSPHGTCSMVEPVEGERNKKEQSVTTEDLHKTIFVDLAIGETPYSDRECLEYEREYLPLHVFANSYVGYQTLIFEDSVRHACAWDHSLGEDTREQGESQRQLHSQATPELNNQSTSGIGQTHGKSFAAIVAQDPPEAITDNVPEPTAQHGEHLNHAQRRGQGISPVPGRRGQLQLERDRNAGAGSGN